MGLLHVLQLKRGGVSPNINTVTISQTQTQATLSCVISESDFTFKSPQLFTHKQQLAQAQRSWQQPLTDTGARDKARRALGRSAAFCWAHAGGGCGAPEAGGEKIQLQLQ